MVLVAPRSAKLVESHGARFTLLVRLRVLPARLPHDAAAVGGRHRRTGRSASATRSSGIGVGFAGTPASHSLTGSVPVQRAGMASGTADLQRDLGGAIMQSILGALLTAGYAAAFAGRDRRARPSRPGHRQRAERSSQKSFASAERHRRAVPAVRRRRSPRRRRQSFLDGADWAYTAGLVAIVLGAALVFFMFPEAKRRGRAARPVPRRGQRSLDVAR